MLCPPHITMVMHAGYECLQLSNRYGTAFVALHGGQLLSWAPSAQRDVLWLSPTALPEPAAVRGGVPVCWPWFAKQGLPTGGMQHGPVRNRRWVVAQIHAADAVRVCLTLVPSPPTGPADPLLQFAPTLDVSLTIDLSERLTQTLHTQNRASTPFTLSQALHTYFAVGQADRMQIEGLDGVSYTSKLDDGQPHLQSGRFEFTGACDNIFVHADAHAPPRAYVLIDPVWERRIVIETSGSDSLVVWNPGVLGASTMVDVPSDAWSDFICIEPANAGSDVVNVLPGASHRLTQTLRCEP
jgi:glucose-6-phosphate 1-epimerase